MTDDAATLRAHAEELERAAARLRSGEPHDDEAADLVERCAELAGTISTLLDRQARAAASEPLDEAPEQERLL